MISATNNGEVHQPLHLNGCQHWLYGHHDTAIGRYDVHQLFPSTAQQGSSTGGYYIFQGHAAVGNTVCAITAKQKRDVVQSTLLSRLVTCDCFLLTLNMVRWLLMYTIQGILSIVWNRSNLDAMTIYHAAIRMSTLGSLFSYITDLLLIMTLAELGNGFLFCLTQTRTALQKAVRYTAVTSCIILSVFAIAIFGVYNADYSHYLSDGWYRYDESLYEASRRMYCVFHILIFVWALLLLAFAAVVFHKTKHNYILKNVSYTPCLL